MVNDYFDEGANSNTENLLDQDNYIVLLVSATPYNVLSKDSRIPEEYMVVADAPTAGLQPLDVLCQPNGYVPVTEGQGTSTPLLPGDHLTLLVACSC